jgi:hypothetical protein
VDVGRAGMMGLIYEAARVILPKAPKVIAFLYQEFS